MYYKEGDVRVAKAGVLGSRWAGRIAMMRWGWVWMTSTVLVAGLRRPQHLAASDRQDPARWKGAQQCPTWSLVDIGHPDLASEVPAKKVPRRRYFLERYSSSNVRIWIIKYIVMEKK